MKTLSDFKKRFTSQVFTCLVCYVCLIPSSAFAQCTGVNVITLPTNQSLMWGTGFTNTTVYIKSDFFINNNFTISGCTVKIEPGIRIVVNAGKILTITNGTTSSHLSACTDMWDGITVEGSTLYGDGQLIIDNNTIVEDAENAVFIPNNSSGVFRIQNSTFNKNWFHILVDHFPGNQYTGASTVINTNFYCKDLTTNIYTTLLPPHSSARTFRAVAYMSAGSSWTTNVMSFGNGNVIENADCGVYNYNSHTDVNSSQIYDCNIGYYGEWDGSMKLNSSMIHDCTIGVESTASMSLVDIYGNHIYRITNIGIFIHANRANVIIYKNQIYEVLDGVVINDNNNDILIHDNQIYNGTVLSFSGSHAVYVQQPIAYPSISLRISANYISQYEQGIFISSFDNAFVRLNYIDMDFIIPSLSFQIFAVKIENSNYFGVAVNTIKGTSIANYCDVNTSGIFLENCNEGGIICNDFGDPAIITNQYTFNKNLLMKGVVNANFIGGNKFRFEHLWSLFIQDSPDGLGIQGDPYYVTDNEWYLSSGSPHCGNFTQDVISDNSHTSISAITEFHVRSGAPFEHDAPAVLSGFFANPNVVSSSPMQDKLCSFLRFSGGYLENSIADGSAFNNNSSDAYKWYSQNWLYHAIPIYPMYSTPLFCNYFNYLDNGNYGVLKSIANQLNTNGATISTANFIPSNIVEENIKNMLDIGALINNQGLYSISIAQKSSIDNLSILCPEYDGPGVYMARAYRSLLDKQLYEYSSTCNGFGGTNLRTQNKNLDNFQYTTIYYSNNELTVKSKTAKIYCVDIFDVSGKTIYSTKINSNTPKNVNLPTGIYLYLMKSEKDNGVALRGKLTIVNK